MAKDKRLASPRPGTTDQARESQLASLAVDEAERRIKNHTASSQVLTHYLKMSSPKAKLELEILEKQKELITAKTESLRSAKKIEEMYANAMQALASYKGDDGDDDDY